ncbi:MAG: hypothetical protein IJ583_00825, partial [Firmicutes bacterium]|nr:hypothetical protein [Bacillota bacterium]
MSNDSEKNLKNENVNENDNKESVKHHHHHHKHRHHKHGKKKNTKNLKIAILCTLFVVAILGLIYAFTADNFTFFDNKDSDKNSTKRVLEANKGNTEIQTESESETTTRNSEVK